MIEMIGGPDRDRTDDLFHAISATSRNSLKLHDINRDVTLPNAQIFPVIGPLMDPRPMEWITTRFIFRSVRYLDSLASWVELQTKQNAGRRPDRQVTHRRVKSSILANRKQSADITRHDDAKLQ